MFEKFLKKRAFTLAETLIVVTVVGVIASIVILTMKTDFATLKARRLTSQKLTALQNVKQTLGTMMSENKLAGYENTDDFINEMKNYVQTKEDNKDYSYIKEVCAKALSDKGITLDDSKTVTLSNGTVLELEYDTKHRATSKNMQDETVCNSSGQCTIVNEAMNYVKGVYDVNGDKAPNEYGQDIFVLSANPNDVNFSCTTKDREKCNKDQAFDEKTCGCTCKTLCDKGFTQNADCSCSCNISCDLSYQKVDDKTCTCVNDEAKCQACKFGKKADNGCTCVCDITEIAKCKGTWNSANCSCDCSDMANLDSINKKYDDYCEPICKVGYSLSDGKDKCFSNQAKSDCGLSGGLWNNVDGACSCNVENSSLAITACKCNEGYSPNKEGAFTMCCSDTKKKNCTDTGGSWDDATCTCACKTAQQHGCYCTGSVYKNTADYYSCGSSIRHEHWCSISRSISAEGKCLYSVSSGYDPLVLDLEGDGIKTSDEYILYDIDGNGTKEEIHNVTDAILCFDKNGNGKCGEDGSELIGNFTEFGFDDDNDGNIDRYPDGFAALRALALHEGLINDKNDTVLDEKDIKILEDKWGLKIKLGGYEGEAYSLSDKNITRIKLSTNDKIMQNNFDGKGNNLMTQNGATFMVDGQERNYADIWHQIVQAVKDIVKTVVDFISGK